MANPCHTSSISSTGLPKASVNANFAKRISAALLAREVIAQAQGVVMTREHVSSSEAAAILHRLARTAGLSVLAQATEVAASTLDGSDASR